MRIAVISPWAISPRAVGGTERFIVDLAESLVAAGHAPTVFMFDGITHEADGVHYVSLHLLSENKIVDEYALSESLGNFSRLETYQTLAQKIENIVDISNFDVIHINTQLLLLAWQSKRRIFTIHTNPFEFKQAWGDSSYDTMIAIACEESLNNTVFTAPSTYYAQHFSKELGTEVVYIPHAINPSRVLSKKDRSALYKQYGLDDTKNHILLPSRLEPVQKQPGVLFDSLKYLPAHILPTIEILSSGVDKQYEQYRRQYTKQAEDLGVSVFFGLFEYMSDAYALADIVVLPSKSESFGYSALESLTLGVPTVLNDIPTFQEIANGNVAATFFNNDSKELALHLSKLLEKNTVHDTPSLGWQQRYSLTTWVKKYEELF